MNGYLLIARFTLDDFPMGFFATKEEALAKGETLSVDDYWNACEMMANATEFVHLAIMEFQYGKPIMLEVVTEHLPSEWKQIDEVTDMFSIIPEDAESEGSQ